MTSPDPTTSTFPNLISQEVASLLTNDLFETGQLLQKILDAWALTKSNAAAKQPRPGYMGHVTKLANHILDFSTEDLIREKINNLSPEVGDSWKDYTENTLAEINKRIQTPLVNEMPSNSFEEDVTRQENALHQVSVQLCPIHRLLLLWNFSKGVYRIPDATDDEKPLHANWLRKY